MDAATLRVAKFLASFGLRCEEFAKAERNSSKTPDLRVFQGDTLVFFCEVKEVAEDTWLKQKLDKALPGEIVGGARPDPIYNRVSNKIHEAVTQLDAVNPDRKYPNVLVFLNNDRMADQNDLRAVLTGAVPLQGGGTFPGFKEYSEGRIREEKWRIDLFIWIDEKNNKPLYTFTERNVTHRDTLLKLLGVSPSMIQEWK